MARFQDSIVSVCLVINLDNPLGASELSQENNMKVGVSKDLSEKLKENKH